LFAAALSKVSWTLILEQAPKLVGEPRKLSKTVSKSRSTARASATADSVNNTSVPQALGQLRSMVEELESRDVEQSELITRIATQGEALSRGIQTISGRVNALIWIAATSALK
jgi:hypothetical protein